ncbi:MAG: SDR family oxidoreductase [Ardenticatenaceae bacterium]|nr:SDR family oxidoreductase [Ardenticatenaceae bacterium]HBY92904.1 hypothetical protein [Chloroflexota bacterium]
MRFEGKVALVTGAGRGIGKAAAMMMAREGAVVVFNDIRDDLLAQAREEATAVGTEVLAINADVTRRPAVKAMVDQVIKSFGKIDILVNNVGGSLRTPRFIEQISLTDWWRVIDLCLTTQFLCCQAVVPHMQARKYGRIVNVSSVAGTFGEPLIWSPSYSAAKAGVLALTRQLALELGPDGITVNAIAQGDTTSERTQEIWASGLWPETMEELNQRYQRYPIKRPATPEEIAAVIVFLASDDSGYITGETVNCNGGQFMV